MQRAEDAALWAFKNTSDARLYNTRCLLSGFKLYFMPTPSWLDGTREVSGLTYCDAKVMYVGSDGLAIVHEYAHALQNCVPRGPPGKDYYHSNWNEDGIYGAIENARFYDGGR